MVDPLERLSKVLSDRYRIERQLGQGGMATVYLAEDLKHHRQVAIKVLKPELAAVLGADRFVQEIATTAALQHPNILPLFDSGEAGGFLYYVMPYVEGETLRDKLNRETQLGIDEAVKITTEVADALQYAHEQGVVHRDIKPENILLRAGRPMVADFGIALAVSAAAGGRMTETGMSLGTPHYMSPEQASAEKNITARSDVYSLGAVLYEMLTGDPPHTGKTAQQIIAKIVAHAPAPVTDVRKSVPANVAAALGKALEKIPADRFESAKAFAAALADPHFTATTTGGDANATQRTSRWIGDPRSVAVSAVALLAIAGVVWSASTRSSRREPTAEHEVRFTVPVSADSDVYLGGVVNAAEGRPATAAVAFSPDGSDLVYAGWTRDADGNVTSQLYARPLDQDHAHAMPGTDSASCPFFSPDGKWIGFFAGASLKRIPAGGGNVETVTLDTKLRGRTPPWGASWAANDTIFYSTMTSIYRVAAAGGDPALVVSAAAGSATADSAGAVQGYGQPELLPGGRALLLQRRGGATPRKDDIVALDLASGHQTEILADATGPIFIAPDRLVFMRRGTLMAVGFAPKRLKLEGEPHPILRNVMQASYMPQEQWDDNAGQIAVSPSGDVAYVPGGMYPEVPRSVERVTPDGHATALGWEPRGYETLRVSPGGHRIAYAAGHGGDEGIYVRDLRRDVTLRLNTDAFTSEAPIWSPDGKSIVFAALDTGRVGSMYRMPADNSGPPKRIAASPQRGLPCSWSSRGVLAFMRQSPDGKDVDIWTLTPGGTPAPFVATPAIEGDASFSPDGRELAYVSSESGSFQVYVRPYPGPGAAVPVSSAGGVEPTWSSDGGHLHFVQPPNPGGRAAMMVADITSRHPFRVGRARTLITSWPFAGFGPRDYDILPNGSFLLAKSPTSLRDLYRVGEVHVILHFLSGIAEPPG